MHVAFVGSLVTIATALVIGAVAVGAIQSDVGWLKKRNTEAKKRSEAVIAEIREVLKEDRSDLDAIEDRSRANASAIEYHHGAR
jgi:hypothetical protein